VDIFIMDDGFQHQKLKRDLDIVAVDATNAWGNGYLLPRGILREPINSLKRADIIVLTRTDLDNQETVSIKRFLIEKKICSPVICSSHKPVELKDLYNDELIDINTLKKKKVSVISAIGNGLSFKKTLQLLGAQVGRHFEYCDHYMYTLNDVQIILKECQRSNINTIITTEKDAVKLLEFKSVWDVKIKILVLKIDMMLYEGKDELIERINRLF